MLRLLMGCKKTDGGDTFRDTGDMSRGMSYRVYGSGSDILCF